jgi:hypothetical protein
MQYNHTLITLLLLLISFLSEGENHYHTKNHNENLRSGEAISFHREYEPNEKAFSFLIPKGWKISGGITRINPNSFDELTNSIGPKLYMKLVSPDEKTSIGWLPDNQFINKQQFATRNHMGTIYPVGNNYNDLEEKAIMSPEEYLIHVAFPFAHPHAQNIKLIDTLPLKIMTKNQLQFTSNLTSPNASEFSAAIITLQYIENEISFMEKMVCVIEDFGSIHKGLWGNKETWFVRTEIGGFNKMATILSKIGESVRLNHEWIEKEIRNQQIYSQIVLKDQSGREAIINKIEENKANMVKEINKMMFLFPLKYEE